MQFWTSIRIFYSSRYFMLSFLRARSSCSRSKRSCTSSYRRPSMLTLGLKVHSFFSSIFLKTRAASRYTSLLLWVSFSRAWSCLVHLDAVFLVVWESVGPGDKTFCRLKSYPSLQGVWWTEESTMWLWGRFVWSSNSCLWSCFSLNW